MNSKLKDRFSQISKIDLTIILSVPIVLLIFYLLPQSIKDVFILNYSNPISLGFFFTHYMHIDFTHFLGNLIVYLISVFLMYFLSVSAKVKKEFYWIFLIFLIVLPLLISAINIFVLDYFGKTIGRTLGFSGINSALLGSVSFFVGAFVKRLVPRIKILDIIFTMLFFVFAVEIMIYQASLWMLILVLAVLLYYLYRIFREVDLNKIIKSFRLKDKDVNAAFLIFITIILYAAVIFSLFPTDIQISENVNVDVLTHYIGLTLGFFMALLFGIRFENKFKSET